MYVKDYSVQPVFGLRLVFVLHVCKVVCMHPRVQRVMYLLLGFTFHKGGSRLREYWV